MTSFSLHILAMITMLCDHIYKTNLLEYEWLTYIGRIAFPIFAFMIVEGYFKTTNLKKYILRIFVFALISEIPFNLMVGNSILYSIKQNVLWTFLIGLCLIWLNEKAKNKNWVVQTFVFSASIILPFVFDIIISSDYGFVGIFTILVFYFFREKSFVSFLGQLICLSFLYIIPYIGTLSIFSFPIQGLAILSLIPIWLYNGKQGYYNNYIKYIYYLFYPLHITILLLIENFLF